MKMNYSEWLYIGAISFQLTGALLLIIRYWFSSIKKEIRIAEEKETRVENNLLILGQTQPSPSEIRENIWLNRFAFICLLVGYLIGIWGESSKTNKWWSFAFIIIFTGILTVSLGLIARKLFGNRKNSEEKPNG